jgi:peptidoglycan-N-acetylglucosamine deacetylase
VPAVRGTGAPALPSMTRRSFLALVPALALAPAGRRVVITMDDANWAAVPEPYTASVLPRILAALGKTKAVLFVVGRNVDNETGKRILSSWSDSGHFIGNHTYEHAPLYRVGPEAFVRDIARNEPVVQGYPTFRRWFRFPQLKEGDTREARDAVRKYLDESGYRNGHVTIDASDWYYDQRLRGRLEKEPGFDVARFREPYLAHILDRARFYDRLSVDVLGRSVGHTLLVHYNLLNALFLPDLIARLEAEGWEIVDADVAYADPVHRETVDVLPAGESLIWSLAHASGRFEDRLRYPGEDGEYEKASLDELGL